VGLELVWCGTGIGSCCSNHVDYGQRRGSPPAANSVGVKPPVDCALVYLPHIYRAPEYFQAIDTFMQGLPVLYGCRHYRV